MNRIAFILKNSIRCIPLIGILFVAASCRKPVPPMVIPQLVKAGEVRSYSGLSAVTYPGKILAASDVKLAFRVAGPILKFYAKEGEFVRKGQLLARLDPRDYQWQFDATAAEYKQVKAESDRIVELYNRHSVSPNDYDKAVAGLKRITALYNVHRNALEDTRLKAPFDGYIQKTYFDAYEIVNQGLPVLSMIDNDNFEVNIDIPSSDYVRRSSFVKFSCVADVYPGQEFPLEFLEINQKANYNQLFKVRFRLKQDKGLKLAAGMSVSVTIRYTPSSEELSILPVSALFERDKQSFVWLYDDTNSVVRMQPVEVTQVLKDGEAVVKSGLRHGQVIIVAGVNSLREGQQVKLLPPVPKSNIGGLL